MPLGSFRLNSLAKKITTVLSSWTLSGVKRVNAKYDYANLRGQATSTRDIFFKDDGLRFFSIDNAGDRVYHYNLTTAWDISTASYAGASLSISARDPNPQGVFVGNGGSKLYLVGSTNNTVYQYSLPTAWTLSGATYDSKSYSVSGQETSCQALSFKSDGTKMYVLGTQGDAVFQYSLSTAWDVSTATYDSVSKSFSAQENIAGGLFFKDDGTKMFIAGSGNQKIYRYDLSTAWDVSTATYVHDMLVDDNGGNAQGVQLSSDGTRVYVVENTSSCVYQYSLGTAYDLTTGPDANSGTGYLSVSSQDSTPSCLQFKPDGTKMYVLGYNSDYISQYSLSTPWRIGSASYDGVQFSVGTQDNVPNGFFWRDNGTRFYMVGNASDRVYSYNLTTAWDLSTATASFNTSISAQETSPNAVALKSDGTKMYVLGVGTDRVYQYSLPTAWSLGTVNYDNVSFLVSGQDTTPTGLFFKDDGTKMYIIGATNKRVIEYNLSTAWNVSTATYSSFYTIIGDEFQPTGLAWGDSGTRFYIVGTTNDKVIEFSLN